MLAKASGQSDYFTKEAMVAVREGDFHLVEKIEGAEEGKVTLEEWLAYLQTEMAKKGAKGLEIGLGLTLGAGSGWIQVHGVDRLQVRVTYAMAGRS